MLTKRQNQMARLMQKELADIFLKEARNWLPGIMLTVTMVKMSPDLGLAKVYVSVFPSQNADAAIAEIRKISGLIRKMLGDSIKNQVRRIPELVFYFDDTQDYMQRIDDALKS
ncbi:MAG TPA: 30S ribosome-binding factor RbfA [Bacteroidales bacterium]|nr:30S ribosome-binding factor RbfA [Bacteroidales bacterium]